MTISGLVGRYGRIIGFCGLCGLATPVALACANPNLHPEWAEFHALVDSFGEQPRLPVQVLYRVSPEVVGGGTRQVMLAFRPTKDTYDSAVFSATPSDKLSLLTPAEAVAISRETVKLQVQPNGAGVHHVRLDITATQSGNELRNIILIPVMAGLHHKATPFSFSGAKGRALAGARERESEKGRERD